MLSLQLHHSGLDDPLEHNQHKRIVQEEVEQQLERNYKKIQEGVISYEITRLINIEQLYGLLH